MNFIFSMRKRTFPPLSCEQTVLKGLEELCSCGLPLSHTFYAELMVEEVMKTFLFSFCPSCVA